MNEYNTRHPNGQIRVIGRTNVIVSPYDDQFYSQIEDGIIDAVRILVDKGYLPISSCIGHNLFADAQCTVVVDSNRTADALINDLSKIGLLAETDRSFDHFGLIHINKLFMRSYTDVKYVKIFMYKNSLMSYIFKKLIIKRNILRLQEVYEYIN